jgi:hypothetical protein
LKFLARRNKLTICCSVWLVCGAFKKAAAVTASIAIESADVSLLILICIARYWITCAAQMLHDAAVRRKSPEADIIGYDYQPCADG